MRFRTITIVFSALSVGAALVTTAWASRPPTSVERRAIVATTTKGFSKAARGCLKLAVRVSKDGRWATSTPHFSTSTQCAAYASNGYFVLRGRGLHWRVVFNGSDRPPCALHVPRDLVPACSSAAGNGSPAARFRDLQTYLGKVKPLDALMNQDAFADASAGVSGVDDAEMLCNDDPQSEDCPVPASVYQEIAPALLDASKTLTQIRARLSQIVPPKMKLSDYKDPTSDCGIELVTVGSAQSQVDTVLGHWAKVLQEWSTAYAAGHGVDFSQYGYDPSSDDFAVEPHMALTQWAVMAKAYWQALSAATVPTWISDLNDEACNS